MIDQSINEIFQRDKKVFIPDFGAFIYSEATETTNFNAHLNFDDGKIIAEIQKQQNVSEEEARDALNEYVQNITSTLNQGNIHFIGGIGYLAKNAQGSISLQDNMSSPSLNNEEEVQEPESIDTNENKVEGKNGADISNSNLDEQDQAEQMHMEIPEDQPKEDLEEQSTDDEYSTLALSDEDSKILPDNKYSYKPVLSEEDEDVQDYYKRKEEFYGEDKKHSPIRVLLWVVMLIIIPASAGLYYFNYYRTQEIQDQDNLPQSQLSHSISEETPAENAAEPAATVQAMEDEHESSSPTSNADVSLSDEQADQQSSIDSQTPGNATTSQKQIYSLIVGSFKKELNADKFQQRLLAQGIDVDKFRRSNNYYFVGIEQIEGKSKAVSMLTEIKKKEPNAWIIRKQ